MKHLQFGYWHDMKGIDKVCLNQCEPCGAYGHTKAECMRNGGGKFDPKNDPAAGIPPEKAHFRQQEVTEDAKPEKPPKAAISEEEKERRKEQSLLSKAAHRRDLVKAVVLELKAEKASQSDDSDEKKSKKEKKEKKEKKSKKAKKDSDESED